MGKGDKKTKRGKIIMGSYGVSRSARTKKVAFVSKPKAEKVAKAPKKVEAKVEETVVVQDVQETPETVVTETVQEEKKVRKTTKKATEGEATTDAAPEKKKKATKENTEEGDKTEKPKAKKAPAKKAKEEAEPQQDLFAGKEE